MAAEPVRVGDAAVVPGRDPLAAARAVARLLDSAIRIPGTSFTIGLDPLIGLIPAGGDLIGALLSGYIVLAGLRLGAPGSVVARMLGNIAIDTAIGSIPILGDLFDVGWRSNDRNVRLLEAFVAQPARVRRSSRIATALVLLALLLVAAAAVALGFLVVRALAHAAR